jgi:uncharacterized protein
MGRRRGTLTLRREDGRVVCETCTVADTTLRRLRGLLGRSGLRGGEGIVLRPAWSIHTAFMRFPIDVVFLDPDQTVIQIFPELRPWRTASIRGAREIVELAAGECHRRGLEVGDRVAWASVADERGDWAPPPNLHGTDVRGVVVVSRDRRFQKLVRFVLDRHGIEAEVATGQDLVEVIEQRDANVVVLDASESLLEAGRAVAAAKALHPRVEIIVVAENTAKTARPDFVVYDKWEETDGVVEQIASALGMVAFAEQ